MGPNELGEQGSWLRRRARQLMGSRLRGWTESRDLAQQVQFEAWRTREGKSFANLGAFRGWLLRILRNLAAGESRRREIELVVGSGSHVADDTRCPSRIAQGQESATWVRERLASLTEREREVVLGRVVDGHVFASLAARLGISEGNARVIFHRSLEKLGRGDAVGPPL